MSKITAEQVRSAAANAWQLKREWSLTPLGRGFVHLRFSLESDMECAVEGVPPGALRNESNLLK